MLIHLPVDLEYRRMILYDFKIFSLQNPVKLAGKQDFGAVLVKITIVKHTFDSNDRRKR